MSKDIKKQRLFEVISDLLRDPLIARDDTAAQALTSLQARMKEDAYQLVVLGEFKRGKSTFVNALLGVPLLPMDVLPETAVIHVLSYAEAPSLTVVYRDGRREAGRPDAAYLAQFSAKGDAERLAAIDHLAIGCPLAGLRGGIHLIDTPGVLDVMEERAEVTVRFAPQANAVIFLLDATAPLKKTEKTFIEKELLAQGIHEILFLANRCDEVDEDELDDILAHLRLRLQKAFPKETIRLYPLSAREALLGREAHDEARVAASGLPAVQGALRDLLQASHLEAEKLRWYERTLNAILSTLHAKYARAHAMKSADAAALQQLMEQLARMVEEKAAAASAIGAYVENEQTTITQMAAKSLAYAMNELAEETEDAVLAYRGSDFDKFVNERIAKQLERECERISGRYAPRVEQMLVRLQQAVAAGLCRLFAGQIALGRTRGEMRQERYPIALTAEDISGTDIAAGAIAAAGGVGLMLLVGGAFMPFVSFAAMPLLRRRMLDSRLAAAKEDVLPALRETIETCRAHMQSQFTNYIGERAAAITQSAAASYTDALARLQDETRREIESHAREQTERQQECDTLARTLAHIEQAASTAHLVLPFSLEPNGKEASS